VPRWLGGAANGVSKAVRCSERQTRAVPLCRQASRTSNGLDPVDLVPPQRQRPPRRAGANRGRLGAGEGVRRSAPLSPPRLISRALYSPVAAITAGAHVRSCHDSCPRRPFRPRCPAVSVRRVARRAAAHAHCGDFVADARHAAGDQLHHRARFPGAVVHAARRHRHPAGRNTPTLRRGKSRAHLGHPRCDRRHAHAHALPRSHGARSHRRRKRRARPARARVSPGLRNQRPVLRLVYDQHHDRRRKR